MLPFLYRVMGSSQSRDSAVETIKRWNSEPRERLICDRGRTEVTQYFQAVDKVQQAPSEEDLNQIIPMAVTRLKHEFQVVLKRQAQLVLDSNSTTTELTSTITDTTSYQFSYEGLLVFDKPSDEVTQYLRGIAERMDSCGHLEACIQVYQSERKPFVDAMFGRLRLDELKARDTRRILSEDLMMRIERWREAARVCVMNLFIKEKRLAEKIFSGLGRTHAHEECFLYVARNAAFSLFSFAESVSLSQQSSERLNVILILYDAMLSLGEDFDGLFPLEPGSGIRNVIAATSSKLGDEVKRMLSGLEDAVFNEISDISADDGGRVHQLTRHVIRYITVIVNHKRILTQLILSRPSKVVAPGRKLPDDLLGDPNILSPLGLHLVLFIAVLQLNLEKKSKSYPDASLGLDHLFMMNNVNYVVHKIKESGDLQEMIGAEYLKRLNEDVTREMSWYQKLTCDRLLDCLRDQESLYVSRCCDLAPRVSASALRSRMRKFDAAFEKMKSLQSSWEVHDLGLREELRRSMLGKLKPAYERFLEKFKHHLDRGEESTKCFQRSQRIDVKYSAQDLQNLVEKTLFSRHQQIPSSSEAPVDGVHLGGA